ncbi:MAG TPA: glutamine synthetase type III [Fermentimonas caenicola]|jgi:glutamine synthetase|uniref:Glutamine synthetase n=1 Tax=Fermentimonas caenicola TaxID=1562970 RepID=A0A098C128_9BACT|nr:glutamine synthetase III [Lascolabacillus sp.]MBP6176177.1 glutamine synthetase III [Fermentimonas sp.]MDI9626597.1 glutamine synthetase III [Bacteroidota bacterium]TAH62126.1 MAG: glutamine synthetase type III [Fermentimonas caenicola]MBP6196191.1 glutamine synthetase III [Fermentimonas sp.]MBP7104070.1 glutamine synthetase III [Fermentimonas sp.]
MSTLRFKAVEEALKRVPVDVVTPGKMPSEYFGKYVFNRTQMSKYLSKETMEIVLEAIDSGTTLNRGIADHVAAGMKMWAVEMGATHYTHWFQPLTEGTAEKHDSFIDYADDQRNNIIERFSGKLLAQQEPDASSFPSGGIRNTFEARGYTAWDPSSPAFIIDDTLCIPTVFISYTGEALDYKTPLLKALNAVDKAAVDVCKLFYPDVKKVYSFLGWEQEYFLVDKSLYYARPDLILTERTLMGHESAKNQQLEDHYFGSIPPRVASFMQEVEYEAYKYGIPLKTCHNEVAPNQFELAPIYGETNLAVDQNLLIMSLMHRIADKHNFKLLLHEKPFAGVNGSGKHNNWSLCTDTGIGLFTPGKSPHDNLLFVTFLVNTLLAVYKHNALLKASIMSANNAHRLGANEAPPAIISVFLGKQISAVLDKIENSSEDDEISVDELKMMKLGVAHIPEVLIDNTDRNRTSPFAFTGNRFEFRAVGSSANCSSAMTALNSVVAAQLVEFKKELDKKTEKGMKLETAIFETLRHYIKESKAIRFEGNGYSEEWKKEAGKRGLDCETSVPLIYDAYTTPQSIEVFESLGVLSEKELHARNEVKWETYTKKIQIEGRVLGDLCMNHIIPVATEYQTMLLDNIYKMKSVFDEEKFEKLSKEDAAIIEEIADHITAINRNVYEMVEARKVANKIEDAREKAIAYHDTVETYFSKIRYHVDKLELIVDNRMWTLPKYRELLFIS